MALVDCPDCGRRISDLADSCPDCGYSFKSLREAEERERTEERRIKEEKERAKEEKKRLKALENARDKKRSVFWTILTILIGTPLYGTAFNLASLIIFSMEDGVCYRTGLSLWIVFAIVILYAVATYKEDKERGGLHLCEFGAAMGYCAVCGAGVAFVAWLCSVIFSEWDLAQILLQFLFYVVE